MKKIIVTVHIDDRELEVHGEYEKGEPEVIFPVDKAYPGTPKSFEIAKVIYKGKDVKSWLDLSKIEECSLNEIEKNSN